MTSITCFNMFERRKIPTLQEFLAKKVLSVIYFEYFRYSSSDCTKLMSVCQHLKFSGPKVKIYHWIFLKHIAISKDQVILFIPLYFVFIFVIKYFSRSFLTAASELKIFSNMLTFISETLCPF